MDIASVLGIIIGLGCLILGYAIEGGSLKSLDAFKRLCYRHRRFLRIGSFVVRYQ